MDGKEIYPSDSKNLISDNSRYQTGVLKLRNFQNVCRTEAMIDVRILCVDLCVDSFFRQRQSEGPRTLNELKNGATLFLLATFNSRRRKVKTYKEFNSHINFSAMES